MPDGFAANRASVLPVERRDMLHQAVLEFEEAVVRQKLELHSYMLFQDGQLISERYYDPYRQDLPHELFSACKSFTSLAVGILIDEGKLSLDDKAAELLPEHVPPDASDRVRKLTVRNLLTMAAGHANETWRTICATPDGNWLKSYFSQPMAYEPGTRYVYSNSNSYVLSAIVQKITGMTLDAFLYERVFEPLGLQRRPWKQCPMGIAQGAHGMALTTQEFAAIGVMVLSGGVYKGKRLVPEWWLKESFAFQIPTEAEFEGEDRKLGYGYHFWRGRGDTIRMEGAFGQECILFPKCNALLVTTGGMKFDGEMQTLLDIVHETLLTPLTQDLTLPTENFSGRYDFPDNPQGITGMNVSEEEITFLYRNGIACLFGRQEEVNAFWFKGGSESCLSEMHWLSDHLAECTQICLNNAYRVTTLLMFTEKGVYATQMQNTGFKESMVKQTILGTRATKR